MSAPLLLMVSGSVCEYYKNTHNVTLSIMYTNKAMPHLLRLVDIRMRKRKHELGQALEVLRVHSKETLKRRDSITVVVGIHLQRPERAEQLGKRLFSLGILHVEGA